MKGLKLPWSPLSSEDEAYNDGRRDGILLGLEAAIKVADLWGYHPMLSDVESLLARVIAEDIRKIKP